MSRLAQLIKTGNGIEFMDRLDPGSVDLCFCDPPFNIGHKYDIYDDNLSASKYLDWSSEWIKSAMYSLRPGGAFWLAIGDDYAAELKVLAGSHGFHLRNWVIWHYTFGVHLKSKFGRCHTHLLYFLKPGGESTWNADAIRVPSKRQTEYNDKRADPRGRVPGDVWDADIVDDVWTESRVCGTFKERTAHTAQMPEVILDRIILGCSNEGDLVCDPFSGSGTTGTVAIRRHRRFTGCELSPAYAAAANARIAKG